MPLPPPPAAAFTSTGNPRVFATRDDGHARRDGDLAGGVLAAHLLHHLRGRADQRDAGLLERLGERGPLGEEAVAGMDRVGAGGPGGRDDGVDVEVALDPDRLVGGAARAARRVEVGEHRDRGDAQPLAVRITRSAISPRLAMRSFVNTLRPPYLWTPPR